MYTKCILISLLTLLGTSVEQPGKCDQTPVGAKVLTPSDPKNAPFQLRIDSVGRKFLEDQTYVFLEATNDSRPFKEFMITVEEPEVDESPYKFEHTHDVGTLMTVAEDSKTRYSERCLRSVENSDNSDKDRIETHWVSPKLSAPNQRIRFRAMVAENKEKWYSGDELSVIVEKDDAVALDSPPYPPNATCNLCSEARYEVIFTGQWSRLTHPNKYPSKPDMNGYTHMIGASHSYEHILWKTGEKAREGLKALVEDADTVPFEREIIGNMSENTGTRTLIRGKRRHHPHMSKPSYALFRVDRIHHLFSLVVGMRPSPDWFLGTKQFELCTNKGWLDYSKIPLYPYDAGTMDGISYDSPRSMTQPGVNVDRVAVGSFNKESPFYQMNLHDMAAFAYLEVRRLNVYPLQDEDCNIEESGAVDAADESISKEQRADENYLSAGYGNSQDQPLAAESRQSERCTWQWSECKPHVGSCGFGIQIREYQESSGQGEPFYIDQTSLSARTMDECPKIDTTLVTRDCFLICSPSPSS